MKGRKKCTGVSLISITLLRGQYLEMQTHDSGEDFSPIKLNLRKRPFCKVFFLNPPPFFRACYDINLVCPAGVVDKREELQLHHNHEKFLFWNVMSLFSKYKSITDD
jgi:hypothetical protein